MFHQKVVSETEMNHPERLDNVERMVERFGTHDLFTGEPLSPEDLESLKEECGDETSQFPRSEVGPASGSEGAERGLAIAHP